MAQSVPLEDPTPERSQPAPSPYDECLHHYEQGFYEQAAEMLSTLLERDPDDGRAASLLAHVYANQGKLTEASRCAEQAVAADRLNPACHMLQAAILQEQGAISEAARALQRALYLEPNLVSAHFALGNIARRQENAREAARHFDNARALLSAYAPEQVLPEFDGMTAGRLLEIICSTTGVQGPAIRAQQGMKTATSTAGKRLTKNVNGELQ